MKYVFLAYLDEKQWDAMSTNERDTLENACLVNEQALQQSGHLFAIEGLPSKSATMTVRIVNGKVSLTDGPSDETKGALVQLFFINARDLNEAIQVASKMPQARRGPIEVRPITEFDRPSPSN